MQKARRHSLQLLRPLVSARFQVLFTFPSRYWFTIGLSVVFSLGGWYRRVQTGFLWSRPTQDPTGRQIDSGYAAVMLFGRPFQASSPINLFCRVVVLQPRQCRNTDGLGSSAFARRYLRNHYCFLFLQVLRCFSSLRWLHLFGDGIAPARLPHSEIRGSRVICTSPQLIAACYVLLSL